MESSSEGIREMATPSPVIIFCPNIDGHRQTYCCVLAGWFLRAGRRVVLAAGCDEDGQPAGKTPLIGTLAQDPQVTLIDLGDTTDSHRIPKRWVSSLREIEERYHPEWTILPTGEEARVALDGLGQGAEGRVKRVAIFDRTSRCYPRDLRGEKMIWRMVRWFRWQLSQFQDDYHFRHAVWSNMGLHSILYTNPDFPQKTRDARYTYLPEIYRAWGFEGSGTPERGDRLRRKYRTFLEQHDGKEVLLYFGGWAARRGYDELLKVAVGEPDAVFVSCGRPTRDQSFQYNVTELRERLRMENRLFEVELPFSPEDAFIDTLYDSCRYVLLPYRHFYNVSGTMIQAASYGKPVLVPDIGYMGSMTRRHGLGMVYRHGDNEDLVHQWDLLRRHFARYEANARAFGASFGRESLEAAFRTTFGVHGR